MSELLIDLKQRCHSEEDVGWRDQVMEYNVRDDLVT